MKILYPQNLNWISMKRLLSTLLLLLFPACFVNKKPVATKVRVIVFDFDGTIADTFPLATTFINIVAAENGYSATQTADLITALREKGMYHVVSQHLDLKLYQLPLYVMKARNFFKEHIHEINVFAGTKEMLQRLTANYEFAIITSNTQENVAATLNKAGITEIKDIASARSVFGKHVVIKRFLKSRKLSPSEILYIGDEIRDIEACKKIGVKIIAVTWGFNSKNALEQAKPDYVADSWQEVEAIVAKF